MRKKVCLSTATILFLGGGGAVLGYVVSEISPLLCVLFMLLGCVGSAWGIFQFSNTLVSKERSVMFASIIGAFLFPIYISTAASDGRISLDVLTTSLRIFFGLSILMFVILEKRSNQ